ncbi:hydantoinase/oxoprolinase family protein [candidate division KSB1 bacterium]
MAEDMVRIGVDTGGTFTDLVVLKDGRLTTCKVVSTPDDPSRAIMDGIHKVLVELDNSVISHGSTVATNSLLTRSGAKILFLTTAGFRDLLHIGRQARTDVYALHPEKPEPLVAASGVVEVAERVGPDGTVLIELDRDDLRRKLDKLLGNGQRRFDSAAVCFLFSYARPEHEEAAAEILAEYGLPVSVSSRVLPEYREFERASTTVVNAYVAPVMTGYLEKLDRVTRGGHVRIMQSNGGTAASKVAAEFPVRTILSGPAGGVIGAAYLAGKMGFQRIITFDMGGTSTDVSLCDGAPSHRQDHFIDGIPVRMPLIDIHTVGAGGGSVVSVDPAGGLKVGPESAGADPGPICYGKGQRLTVTDVHLYLGRLSADLFLHGNLELDLQAVRSQVERMAAELGLPPDRFAHGVIQVADTIMDRALRVVSVERGHDPRDYALFSFGGAGGLHACNLASLLGIGTVIIPREPGVLSALGLLTAPVLRDYSRTRLLSSREASAQKIRSLFQPMEDEARADLADEGFSGNDLDLEYRLDMRYRGQSFELTVPFVEDLGDSFHQAHQLRYGHHYPDHDWEVVALRLRAIGREEPPEMPELPPDDTPLASALMGRSSMGSAGKPVLTPVYDRSRLRPGHQIAGPSLVLEYTATTVVNEGFSGRVDRWGNLVLTRKTAND